MSWTLWWGWGDIRAKPLCPAEAAGSRGRGLCLRAASPSRPGAGASQPASHQARDCVSDAHPHASKRVGTVGTAPTSPDRAADQPGASGKTGFRAQVEAGALPRGVLCIVPGGGAARGSSRGWWARCRPWAGPPPACALGGAAHCSGLPGPCAEHCLALHGPVDARLPPLRTQHGRWARGNPPVRGPRETQAPPEMESSPQFLLRPGGSSCPRAGVGVQEGAQSGDGAGGAPIHGIELGTGD